MYMHVECMDSHVTVMCVVQGMCSEVLVSQGFLLETLD